MRDMTELEMKLVLLRYNMLSKKEDTFAYMCVHASEIVGYEDEWIECIDKMTGMRNDLHKRGYEFVYADSKTAGEVYYSVYKIAPLNNR